MTAESDFNTRLLMVQGTTSDAGKSALVTALCRLLARQGYAVAPFKSQNMALNSAVSVEGGEIGRAQAVQALACGLPPSIRFNPILLKPTGEQCSQVIVEGQAISHMSAKAYHALKPQLRQHVIDCVNSLATDMQFVMLEGAGSPAEINLRQHDLVNMGLALPIRAPVILVADIDRGGVFAHLVGTLELLTPQERRLIIGFVINRFRGDPALLEPGIEWLEKHTALPVLAVIPWIDNLHLDAEDSLSLPHASHPAVSNTAIRVVVIHVPSLSNQTDIDALRFHPDVDVTLARTPQEVTAADLCILPGSKHTLADLKWLRRQRWPTWIARHLRYGGKVLGICGGYQMLGCWLEDVTAQPSRVAGLGWLNHTTRYTSHKILRQSCCQGSFTGRSLPLSGYEIHTGTSTPADRSKGERPFAHYTDTVPVQEEGTRSADNQVIGTYLHGVLDTPEALEDLLCWVDESRRTDSTNTFDMHRYRLNEIDRLADAVGRSLRLDRWPASDLKEALCLAVSNITSI